MACIEDDDATLPMPSTAPHTPSASQKTGFSAPLISIGWLFIQ